MGALSEAEAADVRVIAVTLDPDYDTPEVLAGHAVRNDLRLPTYHLVTGEGAAVTDALDQMGIRRTWNPEKQAIDHTNLFLLIDRNGKVAYRFSIGETQERWLTEALHILCAEPEPRP
ncbi:MAG: SCO family protein [Planctomycetes bacterium]|nr:SCO family protein [Planctomycetota bacterium]